jgi:molecular chaperone DnaK
MMRDAEANAEADKAKRELVELRNEAEAKHDSVDKQLAEWRSKIDDAAAKEIEGARDTLKAAMDKDDVEGLRQAIEAVDQALMKIGQAVYNQGQSAGAAKDGAKDNTVDAEGEDVTDKKDKKE